jgi:hypothetical protein
MNLYENETKGATMIRKIATKTTDFLILSLVLSENPTSTTSRWNMVYLIYLLIILKMKEQLFPRGGKEPIAFYFSGT